MSSIAAARRQVESAGSLAVLMNAAYAAFEEVMSAIYADEDRVGESFAGFAFAAAAAADGRDAVARAPSLLRPRLVESLGDLGAPDPSYGTGELAAVLAGLAGLLAARLEKAAETAEGTEDRVACQIAALQAREVHLLLGGNEP
jgi:hypothetical protein